MQLQYTARRSSRRLDYEYIHRARDAAQGRWHSLLPKLGVSASILTGEIATCPACGGAFCFLDTRNRGEFLCRAPGRADITGDGFALVRHLGGLDFGQAVRTVGRAAGQLEFPTTYRRARKPPAWGGTVDRWVVRRRRGRRGVA